MGFGPVDIQAVRRVCTQRAWPLTAIASSERLLLTSDFHIQEVLVRVIRRSGARSRRLRRVGAVALAGTALVAPQLVVAPSAHAEGTCPSGWVQRSIRSTDFGIVAVFSSSDGAEVVAKYVNQTANVFWGVQADHGNSRLQSQVVTYVQPGASWCSNTAPQPITAWYAVSSGLYDQLTYPAGAPISPLQ